MRKRREIALLRKTDRIRDPKDVEQLLLGVGVHGHRGADPRRSGRPVWPVGTAGDAAR